MQCGSFLTGPVSNEHKATRERCRCRHGQRPPLAESKHPRRSLQQMDSLQKGNDDSNSEKALHGPNSFRAIWTILLFHNGVQLSKVLGTRQPGDADGGTEQTTVTGTAPLGEESVSSTISDVAYLDFDNLPETNFTCEGKVIGGYYADVETGCQMFHVCTIGQKGDMTDIKFLCLNGTVFDQETRVCERVDEVDCSKSGDFYDLNLELYNNGFILPEDERSGEVAKSDEAQESEEIYDNYDVETEEPPATTKGPKTSMAAPNPTPATTAVTTTSKSNVFGTVKPTFGILIPDSKNKNSGAQIIELHQHTFDPKNGPIPVVLPNKQAGTLVRGSAPVRINYQRPGANKPQPPLESKNVGTHLTGLVPTKNLHTPRPHGYVTGLPYNEGQFHKMHHLDTSLKPPPNNFKPFAETTSYKPSSYENYKNHFFPSSSPGPIDSILINFNQKHQSVEEVRSSSQSKRPVVVISHHFPTITPGKNNYNNHPGFTVSSVTSAPSSRHGQQQQPGQTVKLQHHNYQHKPNPTILALQSQQKKVHQLHQEGLEIAEHQIAQIASRNAEISNLRSQKANDRKDDFNPQTTLRETKQIRPEEASPFLKPAIAIVTSTSSTSSRIQNKSVVTGSTTTASSGGTAKPIAYKQETEYKTELEKLFAATELGKKDDEAEAVMEDDSDMDLEQLLLAWKLKTNQEVTKEDIERVFSSLDTSKFKNGQTISLSDIFEITKNGSDEETTRVPPISYDDYTEEDVPYDPFYKDVPKVQNGLRRSKRASTETITVKVLDNGGFVGRELGKRGKNSGNGGKVLVADFRLAADGRKTGDDAQWWKGGGDVAPAVTIAKSSPETRFRCGGKVIGAFYADPEVDCRMFHLCAAAANGSLVDHKFFCREGTKFNQKSRTCEAKELVECDASSGSSHLEENSPVPRKTPSPSHF